MFTATKSGYEPVVSDAVIIIVETNLPLLIVNVPQRMLTSKINASD